mmetsp:Transcript_67726/g.107280  ORF Transcript_67726/g.107280 Transcript_67726/m.107280 type:complete len:420 (-) Transcript_67726:97-1356(-)
MVSRFVVRQFACIAFVAQGLSANTLNVAIDDKEVPFHSLWLRERCLESFYVDPKTKQRHYGLHDEEESLKALTAIAHGSHVEVFFSDGQSCNISVLLIKSEMSLASETTIQVSAYEPPPVHLWTASSMNLTTVDYNSYFEDPSSRFHVMKELLSSGVVMLTGVPQELDAVFSVGNNLSLWRPTFWGSTFRVRVEDDGDFADLAYTDQAIAFHTDGPYLTPPPDYQLLHSLQGCSGSDCKTINLFVDAWHVASKLYQVDPDAFAVLTKIPLRWENNGGDDSTAAVRYAPMIELAHSQSTVGGIPQIRTVQFSSKSGGYSPSLPTETLESLYRAQRKFARMMNDPANTFTVHLDPGAMVVFDNTRVVHARSAIPKEERSRWLQGGYMTRDALLMNYEQLRRKLPPQIPECVAPKAFVSVKG